MPINMNNEIKNYIDLKFKLLEERLEKQNDKTDARIDNIKRNLGNFYWSFDRDKETSDRLTKDEE